MDVPGSKGELCQGLFCVGLVRDVEEAVGHLQDSSCREVVGAEEYKPRAAAGPWIRGKFNSLVEATAKYVVLTRVERAYRHHPVVGEDPASAAPACRAPVPGVSWSGQLVRLVLVGDLRWACGP